MGNQKDGGSETNDRDNTQKSYSDFGRAVGKKLFKKSLLFMPGTENIMTQGDPKRIEEIAF